MQSDLFAAWLTLSASDGRDLLLLLAIVELFYDDRAAKIAEAGNHLFGQRPALHRIAQAHNVVDKSCLQILNDDIER